MSTKTVDTSGSTPATNVIARGTADGEGLEQKKKAAAAARRAPKGRAARSRTARAPTPGKNANVPSSAKKKVWIELDDDGDIPGDGLVVNHNGYPYTIPKGPTEVEEFLVGVLDGSRHGYKLVDAPK